MIGQFLARVFGVCVPLMLRRVARARGGKSPGTTTPMESITEGRAMPFISGELPAELARSLARSLGSDWRPLLVRAPPEEQ